MPDAGRWEVGHLKRTNGVELLSKTRQHAPSTIELGGVTL
jgi:hypothetical protein